jgi:hypothetical protein
MSVFDLLFIVVFVAAVVTIIVAIGFASRGRFGRTIRIVRGYGISLGVYLGIVVVVSLFSPRRIVQMGESRCYDDWCIAVENVRGLPAGTGTSYIATLRLSSRARRVSQRESNLVVYLTDDRDRRYDPISEPGATPLNVLLRPEESVVLTRLFELPRDVHAVGVVIAHQGGFPIGWFIIGEESWFRKPTVVPLPA